MAKAKKKYNSKSRTGKPRGSYKKTKPVPEEETHVITNTEEADKFMDDRSKLSDDILSHKKKVEAAKSSEDKPEGESKPDEKPEGESKPDEKPEGESKPDEKPEGESKPDEKPEGESKPDDDEYTTSNELVKPREKKASDEVDGQLLFTLIDIIAVPVAKKTYLSMASEKNREKLRKIKNEDLELTDPQKKNILKSPAVSEIVEKLFDNMNPWAELALKSSAFIVSNIRTALNDTE